MRLSVRLFSLLRERVGRAKLDLTLPDGSTGQELLDHLAGAYPAIHEQKETIRLAVNDTYIAGNVQLGDGDEVALLTPVSGG